jgi:hypothetical protein
MRTFILSIFIVVVNTAISQNSEWTIYKSLNGVDVLYKQVDCVTDQAPSQIAYIVKLENKTNNEVVVSWDLSVWYNNEKLSHDVADGENHYSVKVSANQSIQGNCETPSGPLYIFKDFITYVSPTKLTRFELENLTVINN